MCGLIIYFSRALFPKYVFTLTNLISILFLVLGLFTLVSAVLSFKAFKTTVNPMRPEKASHLVTSGIFKISRNPMYLGMILIVLSSTVFYLNIYSIFTPFIFYFWINRFQIKREEKFLTEKFGEEYLLYKTRTRRWI